jgi:anti-anti-sigma factor
LPGGKILLRMVPRIDRPTRGRIMQISTSVTDGRMTVSLSERLAFADNSAFRALLEQIREAGVGEAVFDLTDLVSIDSAGLGMFMIALEASQRAGWRFRIVKPQRAVAQLLQLARIDRMIEVAAA